MTQLLSNLCMEKLALSNIIDLHEKIPDILYSKFIYYLMTKNFNNWKDKISLVNMEINIKDMKIEQDMYFDELTYHIYVKKKINDVDSDDEDEDEYEEDDEYTLYHEYRDDQTIYNKYLEIAKMKKLLYNDYEDEYYEEYSNQYFNECSNIYVDF
jgi:hypothetical protein